MNIQFLSLFRPCLLGIIGLGMGFLTPDVTIAQTFHRGDIQRDGNLNLGDPVQLFIQLFRGEEPFECEDQADADDDGQITLTDGILILTHLFLNGPQLPPPHLSGCRGVDLTSDDLDCLSGGVGTEFPPSLKVWFESANPSQLGIRTREILPQEEDLFGAYSTSTGIPVHVVIESTPSFDSLIPAPLFGVTPDGHLGKARFSLICDQDLKTIDDEVLPKHTDLSRHLSREIELFEDPNLLIQRVALTLNGENSISLPPGLYEFTLQSFDGDCGPSLVQTVRLNVVESLLPVAEVYWLADDEEPSLAVNVGSGGMKRKSSEAGRIVLDLLPNPLWGADGRNPLAPELYQLAVTTDLAWLAGAEPSTDYSQHWQLEELIEGEHLRYSLRIDETWIPWEQSGNYYLNLSVNHSQLGAISLRRLLEVEVSYADEVQPLFNRDCSGCHEGAGARRGLEVVDLSATPSEIRSNMVYIFAAEPDIGSKAPFQIWPFESDRSYLYHKLVGTHRSEGVLGSGSRMPLDGPPFMSDEELWRIQSWIDQGAIDN